MKQNLPIVIVIIAMLFLGNVAMVSVMFGIFHFLFSTAFLWKAIFIFALIITFLQLLWCAVANKR